jgi:hypothetical protein
MKDQFADEHRIPLVRIHRLNSEWQKRIAIAASRAARKKALGGFVEDLAKVYLQPALENAITSERLAWFYGRCGSSDVRFAIRSHLLAFVHGPEDEQLIEELLTAEIHSWLARAQSMAGDTTAPGKIVTQSGTRRARSRDEDAAKLRRHIRELRDAGITHREICQRLDEQGWPRPARASWRHLTWSRAYKDPKHGPSVKKWISDAAGKLT